MQQSFKQFITDARKRYWSITFNLFFFLDPYLAPKLLSRHKWFKYNLGSFKVFMIELNKSGSHFWTLPPECLTNSGNMPTLLAAFRVFITHIPVSNSSPVNFLASCDQIWTFFFFSSLLTCKLNDLPLIVGVISIMQFAIWGYRCISKFFSFNVAVWQFVQ